MKTIKYALLIIIFTSCVYEKDIYVKLSVWTLIEKREATRFGGEDSIWLVWQDQNGIKYREIIPLDQSIKYYIGMTVMNRI